MGLWADTPDRRLTASAGCRSAFFFTGNVWRVSSTYRDHTGRENRCDYTRMHAGKRRHRTELHYLRISLFDGKGSRTDRKENCNPRKSKTDNPNIFHEVVELVNKAVEKTAEHQKQAEGYAHGRDDLPERAEDNAKYYAEEAKNAVKEIPGQVEDAKDEIDAYVKGKEAELKGDTGNVYFAAFKVVNGRLKLYSDPEIDKVRFVRAGSRLLYRLNF